MILDEKKVNLEGEKKILFLNTNARSVVVNMKAGH